MVNGTTQKQRIVFEPPLLQGWAWGPSMMLGGSGDCIRGLKRRADCADAGSRCTATAPSCVTKATALCGAGCMHCHAVAA